jgi:hypothetical protein
MSIHQFVRRLLSNRYIASCLPQYAEFWDDSDGEN